MRALLAVAAGVAAVASNASAEHVQAKIRRGELAARAANVGGWLVSEYWMCFTSPLYKNVPSDIGRAGEYAVMTYLGKEQGTKQFEDHWSTYITENDIAKIAKTGLNTVRVTTGYWIVNDADPTYDTSNVTQTYARGSLKYLDKLINDWGAKYNLAVMVSLHAHKGSQNGMDHSAPQVMGESTWSNNHTNVESSIHFAKFIANRYKNSTAFLGLNLMNEPNMPTNTTVLEQYYMDAYEVIRADGNDCIIVTSPLLQQQNPPYMEDFMLCPKYTNVWHEWHIYYKWGWEGVSKAQVFGNASTYAKTHFQNWTGNPIFLGEWSLATTDEVPLNLTELRNYSDTQMIEAEKAPVGWAFWAWRHDEETEKSPSPWSLRQLLNQSVVTLPTTVPTRTPRKCPALKNSTGGMDSITPSIKSSEASGTEMLTAALVVAVSTLMAWSTM